MRTTTLPAIAALFCSISVLGQTAGWKEDFDGFGDPYAYGADLLPTPWEGAASMVARKGLGYGGTAGGQGPRGGWSWGHAFRPTVETPRVGDALIVKIFLPSSISHQGLIIGLTTDTSAGSHGHFAGAADAVVHISGNADGSLARVSFRAGDSANKTSTGISAAPHHFLPSDTWYEVRLTLSEDRKVTAEYRQAEMTYWVPIGTLSVYSDFQPKYVAISASRRATLDDVGYVVATEPGSLFGR